MLFSGWALSRDLDVLPESPQNRRSVHRTVEMTSNQPNKGLRRILFVTGIQEK